MRSAAEGRSGRPVGAWVSRCSGCRPMLFLLRGRDRTRRRMRPARQESTAKTVREHTSPWAVRTAGWWLQERCALLAGGGQRGSSRLVAARASGSCGGRAGYGGERPARSGWMPRSAAPRLRWGILGTGAINDRFLRHAREARAEFVAVGSRTPERAAEFASRHGIPRAHASYDDLLSDPLVEAV